ncbi:hypothetical protein Smp_187680, partial [Schistosoma mansoni]|uniref:hypothetical protein n=1 Tax=Schistosoma mansoni TaxID=6183 RepID=UPI00022DC9F9
MQKLRDQIYLTNTNIDRLPDIMTQLRQLDSVTITWNEAKETVNSNFEKVCLLLLFPGKIDRLSVIYTFCGFFFFCLLQSISIYTSVILLTCYRQWRIGCRPAFS